jgi:hypothetical protein
MRMIATRRTTPLARGALASFAAAILALSPAHAGAALMTFDAVLNGANEVPPTSSTATGFGTVVLDTSTDTITVNESWSGLTAPATLSHIHGPAPVGVNAPVLFPFTGVPAATTGSIPQQTFTLTPAQVTELESGLYYMNVHTSTFPNGEIRGQLFTAAIPEPSSLIMGTSALAIGLGVALLRQRRSVA